MNAYDVAELAQTLFEEAGDALFLFDPDSEQVLDANPMAQRLTGCSRQQLLRMEVTYLFRSEAQGGLARLRSAFRKTGAFHSQDGYFLRQARDGHWLPVNLSITRLHAEPGVVGLITARDMSAHHAAQAQLRKKEAELRRVLASVSDCLWSAELDGAGRWAVTYCSPVVEKIAGRPPEYFRAGPDRWHEVVHPDDRARVWDLEDRCARGAAAAEEEYRIVRPDGEVRWVRDSVRVHREPGGPPRLDGVLTDVTERKRDQERLRRSEKQYRDLVETSDDLIWSVDADGRWTFVNRKAARAICGYEPEEMLGRPFTDFLDPIYVERELAAFARVTAGEPIYQYETVLLGKDGSPVAMSFNAIALRDEAGRFLGATGAGTDVTRRKYAEKALRDSEERFQAFMGHSPAVAFMKDADGRHVYVNRAFEEFDGRPAEEVLGKTDFELRPAEVARQLRDHDLRTLAEDQPRGYLERVPGPDGRPREWYTLKFPFRDAAGHAFLGGVAIDLTERRRAEEALRASEAKYRCLVEHLDQCVFLKGDDLRFTAVNHNFCSAVGRAEAEVLGQTDFDLYPRELADKYRADDGVVLAEGRALQLVEENLQHGKLRTVRTIKTPVKGPGGQNVGVLGIFWDVTDQLNLEAQLRHAQKMEAVGQLAGGIAHDFNNLLTVILGNLSYVLNRTDPDFGTAAELLRNAEDAALRAAELTQRLLGFSRRTMLRSQAVHLGQAVDETVRFLRRTIDPRVEVVTHAPGGLWAVQADPGMVNQVLMNLALNARDAMPQGGQLRVEACNFVPDDEYLRLHLEARPGAFVRLRVRDSGTGIAPEVRQRIFEPFFTTKEVGKGTGLGLAMVFGIVKQHHGWIVCDSEVGRGTTFDVFLPRAHADPAAPAAAAPALTAVPAGAETILVVDDEAMVRNLAALILRRCGYHVLLAEDGLKALEVLHERAGALDLMILDGTMPRLSGRDTLREVARRHPELPVLFSSGYSTDHHDLTHFAQIAGFIQKPYRVEDLALLVRQLLDRTKRKS